MTQPSRNGWAWVAIQDYKVTTDETSRDDPWWDTWAQRDDCCWTWRSEDGWDHPDYQLEPDEPLPF